MAELNEQAVGLLWQALVYAAQQHVQQTRKDGYTPYINHPIEVAELLWRVGEVRDRALLTAAVLHDTIEDTSSTEAEIRSMFGDEVAELVLEVTDNKCLPKALRKKLQVDKVASKSPRARMLKLADKICNVRDIVSKPPSNWDMKRKLEYLDWAEKVLHNARGTQDALESLLDEEIARGRAVFYNGE